jgi:hypothetical protein
MANVTSNMRIAIKAAATAAKVETTWEKRKEINLAAIEALLKKNRKLRAAQTKVDELSKQIDDLRARRDKLLDELPYRKNYAEIDAAKFEAAGGVVPDIAKTVDSDAIIRDVLQCPSNAAAENMLATKYGIHWNYAQDADSTKKKK